MSTVYSQNPLGYMGVRAGNPPNVTVRDYDPTDLEFKGFKPGDMWLNHISKRLWVFSDRHTGSNYWIDSSGKLDVQGDSGGVVGPNPSGVINVLGNSAQGVSVAGDPPNNKLTITLANATDSQKGVQRNATLAEAVSQTSNSLTVTPEGLNSALFNQLFSGFSYWLGSGDYFSISGGNFNLLRSGGGYIRNKPVTWTAPQSAALVGEDQFVYISDTGLLSIGVLDSPSIYTNSIMLFRLLEDAATPTHNVFVVKENHIFGVPSYLAWVPHKTIGPVFALENTGAVIAKNGTKGIQINGADELFDTDLKTTVPDSASAAVTFNFLYIKTGINWAKDSSSTTFPSSYVSGTTITALSAGKYGVFRLYLSKDNLNSTTPQYFALFDTQQYDSLSDAKTSIASGLPKGSTGQLNILELSQLGFVIKEQSTDSIVEVIVKKSCFKSALTSINNTASLITASAASFDNVLTTADTNVQSALQRINDNGLRWKTTSGETMKANHGYITTGAALTTVKLPATAGVGSVLRILATNDEIGSWKITQWAGQSIWYLDDQTTVGTIGYLSATNPWSTIELVCITANTTWQVASHEGDFIIV